MYFLLAYFRVRTLLGQYFDNYNIYIYRVLQLDDNKLVALPKSLNNLGYLEELWLNGNAVKEIPEGLYMISNMRKPV